MKYFSVCDCFKDETDFELAHKKNKKKNKIEKKTFCSHPREYTLCTHAQKREKAK